MTKREWLDACQSMREPMLELMAIVHRLNISEPVTVALNKIGMSWAETDEAGHLYEFDLLPDGTVNARLDRNSLTATSRATNVAVNE